MKRSLRHLVVLCLVLLAMGDVAGVRADVLIDETFEGLTIGSPLTGQDSPAWGTFLNKSGVVAVGAGANASTIVATPTGSTDNTGNVRVYGNFGLSGDDRLALQFDVRAGGGSGDIASLSLGNQATVGNPGPFVGAAFGRFELREDNWGAQHPAKKPDASDFQPVAGTWYRVYSDWDLGAKSGNLLIKDLSGTDPNVSDTVFEQLFFDAGQSASTASLGALSNLAGWQQARIRLGGNGGVGDIDNVRVATIRTLADYQFETSLDLTSSDTEPTSTASNFAVGSGLTAASTAWGMPPRGLYVTGASAADEAGALGGDDYVAFSITPGTGAPLKLAELRFDFVRQFDYSPNRFLLYADEDPGADGDNFTTLVASGTVLDFGGANDFVNLSAVLSDTSFLQGITDTTTFRLYLYGTSATGGTDWNVVRLDSILLLGEVVPEPSVPMLLAGGWLALLLIRRCRSDGR